MTPRIRLDAPHQPKGEREQRRYFPYTPSEIVGVANLEEVCVYSIDQVHVARI
jgi:hypothetical protein